MESYGVTKSTPEELKEGWYVAFNQKKSTVSAIRLVKNRECVLGVRWRWDKFVPVDVMIENGIKFFRTVPFGELMGIKVSRDGQISFKACKVSE